jgi:DnaJ-class molecular chaperone
MAAAEGVMAKCESCNGEGRVSCPKCKGEGSIKRDSLPPGFGEIIQGAVVTEHCNPCGGTGRLRCASCGGSGEKA